MAVTEPIPPLVPRDAKFTSGKGWPGPMPLTRTLPPLADPSERPRRLLSDALQRVGIRPWTTRPTASGEGVVITLDLNDVERLAAHLGSPGARP